MRILILDDSEARHKIFAHRFRGNTVVHAYTAEEAIADLLGSPEPFEVVFLDFDLNFHPGIRYDTGTVPAKTGLDVAQFIRERLRAERFPRMVVVHSLNPVGATAMMQELTQCPGLRVLRRPFTP